MQSVPLFALLRRFWEKIPSSSQRHVQPTGYAYLFSCVSLILACEPEQSSLPPLIDLPDISSLCEEGCDQAVSEPDMMVPTRPQCDDDEDNDGDGLIDRADPG